MAWDKSQVREFVKAARRPAGDGWSLLGVELKRGLLATRFAAIVTSQNAETLNTDDLALLWRDMQRAALGEDE